MAKSKKTKIHKKIDGQILQMNKQFSNLKMKQKDKITEWVYEEYKKYVTEHDKVPDLLADEQIVEAVLDKINEAQIWIPDGEIYDYYRKKKPQLQKRLDNEKVIKFKSYVSFYKSIVDQDRASVVICNLKHEIIYMNPAAVTSYAKRGGDKLIGRSLLDCHSPESRDKIQQVGCVDMQGNYLENRTLQPDILVYNEPEAVLKGEDAQLKAAVDHLLKGLPQKK